MLVVAAVCSNTPREAAVDEKTAEEFLVVGSLMCMKLNKEEVKRKRK